MYGTKPWDDGRDKLRWFCFGYGYVEDSTLPLLFMQHEEGFDTAYEALLNLVEAIRGWLSEPYKRSCCPESDPRPGDTFCSNCGRRIETGEPLDVGGHFGLLFSGTLNEIARLYEILEEEGWIFEKPTSKNLPATVLVEDSTRVLQTVYGEDDVTECLAEGQVEPNIMPFEGRWEFPKGVPEGI